MLRLNYRDIDDPRLRGWIYREWVRCGDSSCRCSTGKGKRHGPYAYLYYPVFDPARSAYRLKKEYVKPGRVRVLRRQIRQAKAQARRELGFARALLAEMDRLCG